MTLSLSPTIRMEHKTSRDYGFFAEFHPSHCHKIPAKEQYPIERSLVAKPRRRAGGACREQTGFLFFRETQEA